VMSNQIHQLNSMGKAEEALTPDAE
jgi:hypothetical protein